ncbi:MAG: hypothetical protein AAB229_06885 [Candidatus Hydrogenedentota bacterium]
MSRFKMICLANILLFTVSGIATTRAATFTEGQEVSVLRYGEWKDGRVIRHNEYGVLVMLPLADGRYDPSTSFSSYYKPEEVRPRDGGVAPAEMPKTIPPAGENPQTGPAATGDTTGAEYFIGTWLTQGHVVFNVVKSERINNEYIREWSKRGGGAVGGYTHIKADGTFVRVTANNIKYRGRWTVNTETRGGYVHGGIVLWGGDAKTGFGDLAVTKGKDGEITIQSLNGGGAGFRGWRAPSTEFLDLDPWTKPSFFQRTWSLYRHRDPRLKTDFGRLTIRANGSFTHTDEGRTTQGTWTSMQENDWILLKGLKLEGTVGDFTMSRLGEDKRLGSLHGNERSNSHLAYYTTPSK